MTFPLVPRPLHLECGAGFFTLSRATSMESDCAESSDAIAWFQSALYELSGVLLNQSSGEAADSICLQLQRDRAPESYSLHIAPEGIIVRASEASGFLYGLVSLLQLVPFDCAAAPGKWHLPAISVEDAPRFAWRGVMLDSAPFPADLVDQEIY